MRSDVYGMAGEDEESLPYQHSQSRLAKLKTSIGQLSQHTESSDLARQSRRVARATQLLDHFQEDPQLLDPHLTQLLPPLVKSLLDLLVSQPFKDGDGAAIKGLSARCIVLCSFCKVRGRKIVARFLENEPRHLDTFLNAHRVVTGLRRDASAANSASEDGEQSLIDSAGDLSWQSEYVILLWLSHLVLTPFDLSTVSAVKSEDDDPEGLEISEDTPGVTRVLLEIGIRSLSAATGQRVVAADLLVRLSLRPDMRKVGLLGSLIDWCLMRLRTSTSTSTTIHKEIGLLSLLNGIVVSGALEDLGRAIVTIYDTITHLFNGQADSESLLRSSAVAKRMSIKVQRNILTQLLSSQGNAQSTSASVVSIMLETRSTLEDVIDFMLQSLGDRDTQVRLAASKALSLIASKLDQDLADEVVEAVRGSMNEDVILTSDGKSYASVDPLRWHGLTMTLSHMLFRRIPSPAKLHEILDTIYMSLAFEQRSSSGHSIGGNVRDAANFGLWSLARRYVTSEVTQNGSPETIRAAARSLVCSACLDPVGNVRRGSSAALQELVGRHPDTVTEGIALIQIIDYQAVGLRSRAMTEIAKKTALLAPEYREALHDAVYDWRGILAPDRDARECAADVSYWLIKPGRDHFEEAAQKLRKTPKQDAEARHGLLMALSSMTAMLSSVRVQYGMDEGSSPPREDGGPHDTLSSNVISDAENTSGPGEDEEIRLFDTTSTEARQVLDETLEYLRADIAQLQPPSRRPDLIGRAIVKFTKQYLDLHWTQKKKTPISQTPGSTNVDSVIVVFTAALLFVGEDSLDMVFDTTCFLGYVLPDHVDILVDQWLELLRSRKLSRIPGIQIALGTILSRSKEPNHKARIIEALIANTGPDNEIDSRVIAIRALGHTLQDLDCSHFDTVVEAFQRALNDYTNTELGDVGSLLRIEALKQLSASGSEWHLRNRPASDWRRCYTSTLTLALGKLDRVRGEAVKALSEPSVFTGFRYPSDRYVNVTTVSDLTHFQTMSQLLVTPSDRSPDGHAELLAVLEGLAISAGAGTQSTMPAAREALAKALDKMVPMYNYGQATGRTLLDVMNGFTALLSSNLTEERVCVPLLETIGFLLDYGIPQRVCHEETNTGERFKFRTLLSLVQKAHFKSTSMPRLLAAVNVYDGLLKIPEIRQDVLTKLISMLLHPFPRVRVEVAKVIWMATKDEDLKPKIWSNAPAEHKTFVSELKKRHVQPAS